VSPIPVVLASASPRRRQLLERIGFRPEIVPAELDEAAFPDEDAVNHVSRLARAKAAAVSALRPGSLVVAGDTVVVLDGEILTKPESDADAMTMLLRLQGREHRVETGVAVVAPDGRTASEVVGADVRFRPFGRATAEAYVATGEPMDKAGAYGIQGRGAALVESIRGDFFAVMGLSLIAVVRLLDELGLRYGFDGQVVEGGG
jgi:septum formation protein